MYPESKAAKWLFPYKPFHNLALKGQASKPALSAAEGCRYEAGKSRALVSV